MTKRVFPLFALLAVILSACSSSGELHKQQGLSAPISQQAVVSLKVTAKNEDLKDEDVRETLQRFQNRLYGSLLSQKVFAQVLPFGQPSHYTLLVDLSGIDKVSTISRVLIGVFAGPNELTANTALLENTTGRTMTQFVATGESATHPFSSEAGMEDAIREAVSQVVKGLKGY